MSVLYSQIIPSVINLKRLGNTNSFLRWMGENHPEKQVEELFSGYKFAVRCCLNSFSNYLSGIDLLDIESNFLFNCATAQGVPIGKLSNSCEQIVLLKNIKPFIDEIESSFTYSDLNESVVFFSERIGSRFMFIWDELTTVEPSIEIDRNTSNKISDINFIHFSLILINNNGPTANGGNPFSSDWLKDNEWDEYFEGYKYAIEYLWYVVLGEEQFYKTSLPNLHNTTSWRGRSKIPKDKSISKEEKKRIQELTMRQSIDYFYSIIHHEIIDPLKDQYKFEINDLSDFFVFGKDRYNKEQLFGDLLVADTLIDPYPELPFDDKLDTQLYWFPYEIVDCRNEQMFHSNPSFHAMLVGMLKLHKPQKSAAPAIMILKLTHPYKPEKDEYNYSYGIFIDTEINQHSISSGWVIYKNVCGDWSGFSGSQYKYTEKLIKKYLKRANVELRELYIPLDEFDEITASYRKREEENILRQNRIIPDIIQKLRSYFFEHLTYHIHEKYYIPQGYKVSLNVDKNAGKSKNKGEVKGEKDIVVEKEDEVVLIECKLNAANLNLDTEIKKLEAKLLDYDKPKKSMQFWFYYDISEIIKSKLKEKNIHFVVVSNPERDPILQGVKMKELKFVMQKLEVGEDPRSFKFQTNNFDFDVSSIIEEYEANLYPEYKPWPHGASVPGTEN